MLFLQRFGLILLAYALAALTSGYVVAIAARIDGRGIAPSGSIWLAGLVVTAFIVIFASAPATAVIIYGEVRREVRWWYYAITGSIIGWGLGRVFMRFWEFQVLGLCFGVVAGLIYWRFAGQHAGILNGEPTEAQHRSLLILLSIVLLIATIATVPNLYGIAFT